MFVVVVVMVACVCVCVCVWGGGCCCGLAGALCLRHPPLQVADCVGTWYADGAGGLTQTAPSPLAPAALAAGTRAAASALFGDTAAWLAGQKKLLGPDVDPRVVSQTGGVEGRETREGGGATSF